VDPIRSLTTSRPISLLAPVTLIKRYIQNHRIHALGGDSQFDAVSETWSDQIVTPHSADEAGTKSRLADEANFMDLPRREHMIGLDRIIMEGSQSSGMVQGIFQLRRRNGISRDEFRIWWLESHFPIVRSLPGLSHYHQCLTVDEAYSYCEPRYDGVEGIWFDDIASAQAALQSTEYTRSFWPDLVGFAEVPSHFFAEAMVLIWPGKSKNQILQEIGRRLAQGWNYA